MDDVLVPLREPDTGSKDKKRHDPFKRRRDKVPHGMGARQWHVWSADWTQQWCSQGVMPLTRHQETCPQRRGSYNQEVRAALQSRAVI